MHVFCPDSFSELQIYINNRLLIFFLLEFPKVMSKTEFVILASHLAHSCLLLKLFLFQKITPVSVPLCVPSDKTTFSPSSSAPSVLVFYCCHNTLPNIISLPHSFVGQKVWHDVAGFSAQGLPELKRMALIWLSGSPYKVTVVGRIYFPYLPCDPLLLQASRHTSYPTYTSNLSDFLFCYTFLFVFMFYP